MKHLTLVLIALLSFFVVVALPQQVDTESHVGVSRA